MASENTARIPQLDGWRGISVALVIVAHAINFRLGYDVQALKFLGTWGVDIFFVISGFIITKLAHRERERTGALSVRDFYLRRAFRIIPPLFVYLAAISILGHLGLIVHHQPDTLLSAAFVCNIFDCGWFVTHTWSLAYEEQFYLLFPLIFAFFFPAFRLIFVLFLAVLLVLPFAGYAIGSNALRMAAAAASGFSFICLGASIAANQTAFNKVVRGPLYIPISLIAGASLSALLFSASLDVGLANMAAYVQKAAVAILLPLSIGWIVCSSTIRENQLSRALTAAPITFVGRISYSLYLWQMLFTAVPSLYAGSAFNPGLMLVAAVISYYVIERPMINLGKFAISAWSAAGMARIGRVPDRI